MSELVTFDANVLNELDKWVRSKGGKVQARLISEFYSKNPAHKTQLQNRLYSLADCEQSKVHIVAGTMGNSALEFLELKHLGSRPLRQPLAKSTDSPAKSNTVVKPIEIKPVSLPIFTRAPEGHVYSLVRDPAAVRAQLQAWAPIAPFAFDFKGDIRRDGRIALVQISNRKQQVLMVDMVDNPKMAEDSGLKDLLQDPNRIKVILDCARSAEALRWLWGVELTNVFDLSRAFLITKTGVAPESHESGASLVNMINDMGLTFVRVLKPEESWFKRPLSPQQIEYSVRGVMLNMEIYDRIVESATSQGLLDACLAESARHANSLRNAPDERDSVDWVCTTCGFENFARRYTCKKCESTKPSYTNPAGKARPHVSTNPTPSSSVPPVSSVTAKPTPAPAKPTVSPEVVRTSTPISSERRAAAVVSPPKSKDVSREQDLEKIEEEALRMAMEMSLKEEQDRVERQRSVQLAEIEAQKRKLEDSQKLAQQQQYQSKANSSSTQSHGAATAEPQGRLPSQQQSLQGTRDQQPAQHAVRSFLPPFETPSSQSSLPPLVFDAQFVTASGIMSSDESNTSTSSHLPNLHLPNLTDRADPTFFSSFPSFESSLSAANGGGPGQHQQQQHRQFNNNGMFSFPMEPHSAFGPFDSSSLGLPHSLMVGGLPGYPLTQQQMNQDVMNPAAARLTSPSSSLSSMLSTPPPQKQHPSGLSEDELLLLTLDAQSLLEELNFDAKWVEPIVECAAKVGAKCELIEAPLPMFSKAMEQSGLTVGQRATILKELHQKKNKVRNTNA